MLHAWLLAAALGILVVLPARSGSPVTLNHVHGLSYGADGKQLLVPGHDGLAVYAGGRWSMAEGPGHDYVGFSAARSAWYSSGHPAPGSGLSDPLGLRKSIDGGKTWQQLGLSGEADFHTLATSYETNAVYVANREANSRMARSGIHYTLADGLCWRRAASRGLGRWLHSLAVHPTDAAVVAAGTDTGLYLSRDSAESFERLVGVGPVLAESFDMDRRYLWFSTYVGKATLARINLKARAQAEDVPIPALPEDAVAYIALNPVQRAEIAIATFKRSVFVSRDRGRTWTQIARTVRRTSEPT